MKTIKRTSSGEGPAWAFYCPGCDDLHFVRDSWTFNGNEEKPTFTPSVLVTYSNGERCHLFVQHGLLSYCNDSSHALAGKVVEMEPVNVRTEKLCG